MSRSEPPVPAPPPVPEPQTAPSPAHQATMRRSEPPMPTGSKAAAFGPTPGRAPVAVALAPRIGLPRPIRPAGAASATNHARVPDGTVAHARAPSTPPAPPAGAASATACQTVQQFAGAMDVDGALTDHGSTTDSVDVMPCGWAGDSVSPPTLDAVTRREQAWTEVRTAAEQAFWARGSRSLPVQVPSQARSRSPPCRRRRLRDCVGHAVTSGLPSPSRATGLGAGEWVSALDGGATARAAWTACLDEGSDAEQSALHSALVEARQPSGPAALETTREAHTCRTAPAALGPRPPQYAPPAHHLASRASSGSGEVMDGTCRRRPPTNSS